MGTAKHAAGTARDVVLPYLAAQAEAARAQLPGALRSDHDAVHDLRVALRRSRATLQAFRSMLGREQQVRAEALAPGIAAAWHAVRQAAKRVVGRGSSGAPQVTVVAHDTGDAADLPG